MRVIGVALGMLACGAAWAEPPKLVSSMDIKGLQAMAEDAGLRVVAIEPGSLMAHESKHWPVRFSLAACNDGLCASVRAYSHFVVGDNEKGLAAIKAFAESRQDLSVMLVMSGGEPAAEVGIEIPLANGRTPQELKAEVLRASQAGEDMRNALCEADPFLRAVFADRTRN